METNVWTQLYALVAGIVSLLSKSSVSPQNQSNGGELPNAPKRPVDSTSTSKNATTLTITRGERTTDAVFGEMAIDGKVVGVTMERTAVAIPEETYTAHLEMSPHFGFPTPHIDVPNRTYIEIHPANFPSQLEGCVAVGSSKDGDALDNSRLAFDRMMEIVPQEFTVIVK